MGSVFGAMICAGAKTVSGCPFDHIGVVVRYLFVFRGDQSSACHMTGGHFGHRCNGVQVLHLYRCSDDVDAACGGEVV